MEGNGTSLDGKISNLTIANKAPASSKRRRRWYQFGQRAVFFLFVFCPPSYSQFSPIINFDQSKKTARTVREEDGGGEMEPVCRQAAEQGGRGTHRCTGGRQSPPFDFLFPFEQLTSCESGTERIKKVKRG